MKAGTAPAVFPVLAHQGGWDEILLVAGPLMLIAGALWVANRRVSAQLSDDESSDGQSNGERNSQGRSER